MSDINARTRFAVRPLVGDQLLGISDDCLLLQHSAFKMGLNFSFGGVLTFLFMGLPMALFVITDPWLPPYGYRDNIEITSFIDKITGLPIMAFVVYLFFYVLLMGGLFILMTYLWPVMTRKEICTNTSALLFNRRDQTVSAVHVKKEVSIPWHEVKGTVGSKTFTGPGLVPMTRGFIKLEGVGQIEGDEAMWEYIRIFMQEGPNRLTVMPYISDSWDHEPMYSRTFKQSIAHQWPWPIVKNPGVGPIISWLIWPVKVVGFIPFVMTDWWWRRMIKKCYHKSNNFPEHRWAQCKQKRITGQMATQVATKEDLDTDGINYLDLKRRLGMDKQS